MTNDRRPRPRDVIYRDRNILAINYASLVAVSEAGEAGWYYEDPAEADFPIVWAEPPGTCPTQMGWHVPPSTETLLRRSPVPNQRNSYDEHTRQDRNNRLLRQIERVADD